MNIHFIMRVSENNEFCYSSTDNKIESMGYIHSSFFITGRKYSLLTEENALYQPLKFHFIV